MTAIIQEQVKKASKAYPKDASMTYSYGTAGFRYNNNLLDSTVFRMGILATLRSQSLNGKTIGVMITASHNQESDNGVKIVDPMGEMLAADWEQYATSLANVGTHEELAGKYAELVTQLKIDTQSKGNVVVARDTRSSGPRLVKALVDGIQCVGGKCQDFNEMTTPQLHYYVRCLNTNSQFGKPTEQGYFDKMMSAFIEIVRGHVAANGGDPLTIDCANGIGALKMFKIIEKYGKDIVRINLANTDTKDTSKLNSKCGADFVKVDQTVPAGLTSDQTKGRCASFDGDADRVVYFFVGGDDKFCLLDGDKIAALAAGFIKDLLLKDESINSQVKLGVVQTAYANGSSTKYFEQNKIPVVCAETGVKNLHHEAEKFDIGIYFEANGHGTILFSERYQKLASASKIRELKLLPDLINQTVGDAISDMLLVEAILCRRKWSLQDWASKLYIDLPNRQLKVSVPNRQLFTTTNAERTLVTPKGLQQTINDLVAKYQNARSFVRPSGTEDVVRVYAEAATREECDKLAEAVANAVKAASK